LQCSESWKETFFSATPSVASTGTLLGDAEPSEAAGEKGGRTLPNFGLTSDTPEISTPAGVLARTSRFSAIRGCPFMVSQLCGCATDRTQRSRTMARAPTGRASHAQDHLQSCTRCSRGERRRSSPSCGPPPSRCVVVLLQVPSRKILAEGSGKG